MIRRDEIHEVLARGTPEQLRVHLSRYTKEELKPLHFRLNHAERKPFPFGGLTLSRILSRPKAASSSLLIRRGRLPE